MGQGDCEVHDTNPRICAVSSSCVLMRCVAQGAHAFMRAQPCAGVRRPHQQHK